ncbi:uncharacterized protein N7458_001463, partial [Penicillium daleae]
MELAPEFSSPGRMKRSYASVKIVLQRGKIERLKQRLQTAGQLLQLSQQCYTRLLSNPLVSDVILTLLQIQPDLIAARLTPTHPVKPACGTHTNLLNTLTINRNSPKCQYDDTPVSKNTTQPQRRQKGYLWRLTLPSWMSSKALDLAGIRVPAGWNWYIRVYNLIPRQSKVVDIVIKNEIVGLREIFASKQASPLDRIPVSNFLGDLHYDRYLQGEMTLLHVVWPGGHRILIEQGCDPTLGPLIVGTALTMTALQYGGLLDVSLSLFEQPLLRALLPRADDSLYDPEGVATGGVFRLFGGTSEDFLLLQQQFCPSFFDLPTWVRMEVAANIAIVAGDNAIYVPQTIRTVLGGDIREITTPDLKGSDARTSLLNSVATRISNCRAAIQRHNFLIEEIPQLSKIDKYWNRLLYDLLDTDVNTDINLDDPTPFSWMRDLKDLGIDLLELGRKEREAWDSDRIEWLLMQRGWSRDWDGRNWTLVGFHMVHLPRTGWYGYTNGISLLLSFGIWWKGPVGRFQVHGLENNPA